MRNTPISPSSVFKILHNKGISDNKLISPILILIGKYNTDKDSVVVQFQPFLVKLGEEGRLRDFYQELILIK